MKPMDKGSFYLRCILMGILAIAVVGLVTMLLWNWLVPIVFNGPAITYWQALGLLVLSKILFSGLGGKHGGHKPGYTPYWKQRFYDKVSTMSEAEREAFKKRMKEKWCRWEKDASASDQSTSAD